MHIQVWRDTFDVCNDSGLLNETEKAHHCYAPWHLEEELRRTGQSLWRHDTSGVEKTHSAYRKFQKEHNFEVTKTIGIYRVIGNSSLKVIAYCSQNMKIMNFITPYIPIVLVTSME